MNKATGSRPCRFFAAGYCRFGDDCRFVHQAQAPQVERFASAESTSSHSIAVTPLNISNPTFTGKDGNGEKAIQQCQYFKAGRCYKGKKCRWSHDPEETQISPAKDSKEEEGNNSKKKRKEPAQQANAIEEAAVEAEPKVQARLQALRQLEGTQAHLEAERKAKQVEIAEREAGVVIRQVVMEGSILVTCAAGLDVRNIVCGFESCYLTIKNLPQNIKRHEIEELFTQQGVDTNLFCIVKQRQVNGETEAKVMFDAEVGLAVAAGLDGMDFRDDTVLDISLDDGGVPNKMGSATERNINVLSVSWRSPSTTMIIEYGTTPAAVSAVNRLNNTVLGGRKIRVVLNRGARNQIPLHSSTSAKILNLPPNATQTEVQNHTGGFVSRSYPPSTFPDTKEIERGLRRHVETTARFESFEVSPSNPSKPFTDVRVRFHSWDDAKRVHDSLQGKVLRFDYPTFKVWLPKPIQYVITIPLAQYRAQKGRWDSMAEGDDNKAAFIHTTNDGVDRAFVRVLGEDKKAVGQLKVRVENLVAGETLDVKLWHRSFMGAAGRRFLDDVSSSTRAYVRADWKTKTLRLYAEGNAKGAVIGLVEAKIERLEALEWSTLIPRYATGFFMRKGLPALKEELGEDAVTLELFPVPRLVVRGGEEAHRAVDRLLGESRAGIESSSKDGGQDMCPICFDEVSSPVLLTCGHYYCTACIRLYLSSAAERKTFPLACAGDEASCKVPIAIPIIRRFLLPQQYDQLIEAAVTVFIEKQPNTFKYCTTPDCLQVYRYGDGRKALTCPSCFATVCTSCHKEAHEGMTCREREIMTDPEEQERLNDEWARGAGAKRCPACRVWIQKTEGCNHMTCKCGAHLCWICLARFDNDGSVYTHMHAAHGGINDNDVQRQQAADVQGDFAYAQRLQREEEEHARAQGGARVHDPLFNLQRQEPQRREREQRERQEGGARRPEWYAALREEIETEAAAERQRRLEAQQRARQWEVEAARLREIRQRRAEEEIRAREQTRSRGSWCIIM